MCSSIVYNIVIVSMHLQIDGERERESTSVKCGNKSRLRNARLFDSESKVDGQHRRLRIKDNKWKPRIDGTACVGDALTKQMTKLTLVS